MRCWPPFFGEGLSDVTAPDYSHAIRWRDTRRTRRFFSADLNEAVLRDATGGRQTVYCPEFSRWGFLERSQYLEISIFLRRSCSHRREIGWVWRTLWKAGFRSSIIAWLLSATVSRPG